MRTTRAPWTWSSRRRPRSLAILLTAQVLFGACGSDGGDDTAGSAANTTEHQGGSDHGEQSPVPEGARHVEVTARTARFDPGEITVAAGEPIAIVLAADDVDHDFVVDELDLHVSAEAGETGIGGFEAGEAGRFMFYCSVEGHREAGMEGTLVVEAAT